jgi:hypothetical protein
VDYFTPKFLKTFLNFLEVNIMEHDLHSKIASKIALSPSSISSDTTTDGQSIDTNGFESLDFQILSGALNSGTFTAKIQESEDDGSGISDGVWVDVDPELVLGEAIFESSDSDTVKRLGTISKARFVRLSIVSSGGASGANGFSSLAILGNAKVLPTS